MFIAGFAQSYGSLLICGFFFGLVGTSFAVGIPQVSQWYPKEKQGLALGIYGVAISVLPLPHSERPSL